MVEDSTIKDCPIKETLRWARIRQHMFMKGWAERMGERRRRVGDEVMIKEEEVDSRMGEQ